ncbi:hypothetical protein GBF38_012403 [Xyrichtys novacula]|uniref:Uncharacterized protein n=1 Tax=Xyrichtys novacula TaxID=13765 RepID=A0AAV1FWL6_XYRNO|nr:hypothetical protein GBF38_012403 [Xyrichtys novacula]
MFRHSVQHAHTYACRQNNIRLLVDKWLNLPDRPVWKGNKGDGGSRDGEGWNVREEEMGWRHDKSERWWKEEEGEGKGEEKEGKEGRVALSHEGRGVAVGRQQLEGMINSADTSVYISAEW